MELTLIKKLDFRFLWGFWYRFLVDAKIYEIKKIAKRENKSISEAVKSLYDIEL